MAYKPSDYFVGVIDFFAIVLPGAIVLAVLYQHLPEALIGGRSTPRLLPQFQGEIANWVAFILGAYLIGHLLFLIGSVLDSLVYDPIRSALVPMKKDRTYQAAKAVATKSLGSANVGINVFQWSRAMLRLRAPEALVEVERYEADSKFFRGLCVAMFALIAVFLAVPLDKSSCVPTWGLVCSLKTAWAIGLLFAILLMFFIGTRVWHSAYEHMSEKAAKSGMRVPERPTPPIWLWVIVSVLAVSLIILMFQLKNWAALVSFVLFVLCLARYGDRRWKSTRTAYQYVVILDRIPTVVPRPTQAHTSHG